MIPLVFATHNKHKAKEIGQMLHQQFNIQTLDEISCTEDIEEYGETLTENASIKSTYVYKKYHQNCFADDTGLIVPALNGSPGVKSARYAGSAKNDDANMDLLLTNLSNIENRYAYFHTVISLWLNEKEYFFEGVLEGTIGFDKKGTNGFGYDPIFIPLSHTKTLAELTSDEKNTISHRGKAIEKLITFLTRY